MAKIISVHEQFKLWFRTKYDNWLDWSIKQWNRCSFLPYVPHIFSLNNLYPHVIKSFNLNTEEDEIKTKIRYRQFKRFRATGR